MTCTEYHACLDHPLASRTRAERAAEAAHYLSCQECRKWFDNEYQDDTIVTKSGRELALEDMTDPEFQNIVKGAS